jgi:hypothetical protein
VNCRHLISYSTVDDDFDTDFGYSGKVQYGLIIRDPDLSDQAASSTSEGFESDNDGASSTRTPMTTAVFTNITMVGPYRGNTTAALPANADFARCIRIRRNSGISILNSIFTNFPTGIEIKDAATSDNVLKALIILFTINPTKVLPTLNSVVNLKSSNLKNLTGCRADRDNIVCQN